MPIGATFDWTLDAEEGWGQPARLVNSTTIQLDLPARITPLPQPPILTSPPINAVNVSVAAPNDEKLVVYEFEQMLVGTVVVGAGAWQGEGAVRLEFCEALLAEVYTLVYTRDDATLTPH